MNLEVFSRVVMRSGFQKNIGFSNNKMHILKKKNIPIIPLIENIYVI